MQIKQYSIVSTKFADERYSLYEAFWENKVKVYIFEFYLKNLSINNPNDVINKILIPADIGNPIEIISCFIGFNGNLFIALPFEFERLSRIRGIYLEYDLNQLNYFIDKEAKTKILLVNGKSISGKSFLANILNIYFVIKKYETFFFTAIFKLMQDVEIVNEMMKTFFIDEIKENKLSQKIQFGYFQEKYQKLFAGKILSFASKSPVIIFFDNIELLSKNVQNLILGIYKTIQINPGNYPVIFCLISVNGISHLLVDDEMTRNTYRRVMPHVTYNELLKLANFIPLIKKSQNNNCQSDLIHHLYKITEGQLSNIQFVLSRIALGSIEWDEKFINMTLDKIYAEELAKLNNLDLLVLSIFKAFKIPLSFLAIKYISPICLGENYQFDQVYDSILKLKDLFILSTVVLDKNIHFSLNYKEMLPYIPDFHDPNKIYESCGDYYNSIGENHELILYCYINSKNLEKTLDSLYNFIEIYKKMYDFEPILFYIDKVLQTFSISQEKRFELLYEKAEIYSHISLWFESLSMLYELLPYSLHIEKIYYYICYNYFYLGEYDAIEEFILAYQHIIYSNDLLKIKTGFIQAPIFCIKNEREKALSLIDELYNLIIKREDKEELLKEYFVWTANCYYILGDVSNAKKMINRAELKKEDLQSIPYFLEIYLLQAKFALYEKQYNISLSWTNKGLTLCEQFYNLRYISDFYYMTAMNLFYLKNYNSALSYFKKASKLKEDLNHKFDLGIIRYYEALTLFKKGNFSQAISKTFKAAHIFKILGAKQYYKKSQLLLIKSEFELRNYERAFYLLRAVSKEHELSEEEKDEILFYITRIQETIVSMSKTVSIILESRDFSKIPTYFNSMRNTRVSFDDLSLKLVYSLQHIVDQNPHFEKVYEEILIYLTNYSNADISYLVLNKLNKEFEIISKYSPLNLSLSTNKETIFELLKLKILYEEKVTTLSYDNENIVCIPLYRISRLPASRAKKITSRIRKNYLGFILLFFSNEPQKETIFSISSSYSIINSIIVNSLEYNNLSKEDDYTYRFKVFKEIVVREIHNCNEENHNYAFGYIKIDSDNSNFFKFIDTGVIKEFGISLNKYFRSEDLITRISENEYFIFLPFAEKHGKETLKMKITSWIKNLIQNEFKDEILKNLNLFYAFSFNVPSEKNIIIDLDIIIKELKENAVKIQLNQEL